MSALPYDLLRPCGLPLVGFFFVGCRQGRRRYLGLFSAFQAARESM